MTFLCLIRYKCSFNTVNAQLHRVYACLLTVFSQALKWGSGRWAGGGGGRRSGGDVFFYIILLLF